MLGFRYLKVPPTTHVVHFRNGKLVREGAGLAYFYFAPPATIAQVPVGSVDLSFVFNEVTADFQDATLQGELTYRVARPVELAHLLDFSVDVHGRYRSDDPSKLNERLTHAAQILTRAFTQKLKLSELLISSEALVDHVLTGLRASEAVAMLGIEVLGLSILSIKATPEMAKALQASAREQLLQRADEAIYARRNMAVELERQIKENELNTEVAVAQKRRQVRETQLRADVAIEEGRAELVDRRVENERKESQSRADALQAILGPIKDIDWRTLMAAKGEIDARQLIAIAFRDLADHADKIGTLNISPDLLSQLLDGDNGGANSGQRKKPRGDQQK